MDNFSEEKKLYELLSGLKDVCHIPVEFLLADAGNKLSSDGHIRVEEHVKDCDECAKALEIAKNFIQVEKECSSEIGKGEVESIPKKLSEKLEVHILLSSKRDDIVEEIAKLFLPEDSWFVIRPGIALLDKGYSLPCEENTSDTDGIMFRAVAAFADDENEHKEAYGVVSRVFNYVDSLLNTLQECTSNVCEIKSRLTEIESEATTLLFEQKNIKKDKRVLEILEKHLKIDGVQK